MKNVLNFVIFKRKRLFAAFLRENAFLLLFAENAVFKRKCHFASELCVLKNAPNARVKMLVKLA